MARRNQGDKWLSAIPILAGIGLVISFLFPSIAKDGFHKALLIVDGLFILLVAAGLVIALIRLGKIAFGKSGETVALPPPRPVPIQTTSQLVLQIRTIDWFQFEKLVEIVFTKLGYEVTRRGGANPDGGIDLIVVQNGEPVAIQCKQWKTRNVPVKEIREFLGALTASGIKKGLFITLYGYTQEAEELALKHNIEVVNEIGFSKLLEAMDARYNPEFLAVLQDQRKFCPKCESEMVRRTASKGPNAGRQFWGCSTYPRCSYTMQVS